MKVIHSRIQHGVGQGSFHSASVDVTETPDSRHRFDYVYDCGALAGRYPTKELKRSAKRLSLEARQGGSKKAVLDVLVLSHFDRDHMNGAQDLARQYEVNHIVLPYLGPDELAFVIASQADDIEDDIVAALHSLATGGSLLWGKPVTMVQRGLREPGRDDPDESPNLRRDSEDGEQSPDLGGPPKPVTVTVSGTGIAPSRTMPDEDDLMIKVASDKIWRLRFWNRGLDQNLINLVKSELTSCSFPVAALNNSATGATVILHWLAEGYNRDLALDAYRKAIT